MEIEEMEKRKGPAPVAGEKAGTRNPYWPAAFGTWFMLLAAAFAAATIREVFVVPRIGEHAARAIASIALALIVFCITLAVFRRLRLRCVSDGLAVGVLWTLLTAAFEFSMGLYRELSLAEMLADYNVFQGRLWPLVLISTLVSPIIAFKIRGRNIRP
jgi:hypothetical protein